MLMFNKNQNISISFSERSRNIIVMKKAIEKISLMDDSTYDLLINEIRNHLEDNDIQIFILC